MKCLSGLSKPSNLYSPLSLIFFKVKVRIECIFQTRRLLSVDGGTMGKCVRVADIKSKAPWWTLQLPSLQPLAWEQGFGTTSAPPPTSQPPDAMIYHGRLPSRVKESPKSSLLPQQGLGLGWGGGHRKPNPFLPPCASSRDAISPLPESPPSASGPNRPPLILIQIHIVLAE